MAKFAFPSVFLNSVFSVPEFAVFTIPQLFRLAKITCPFILADGERQKRNSKNKHSFIRAHFLRFLHSADINDT